MRKITLTGTFAIVVLTASLIAFGASAGLAGAKSSPRFPGWYDTNATAAQSRANLVENILSPSAVTKVIHLRSMTAPPVVAGFCRVQNVVAPVPAGNALYAGRILHRCCQPQQWKACLVRR